MHHFKLFNQVKSTQDEKGRFIKGNELKLTQAELLSFFFFFFKWVYRFFEKMNDHRVFLKDGKQNNISKRKQIIYQNRTFIICKHENTKSNLICNIELQKKSE